MIIEENKPHYVCIKDLNRFMCNKKKLKIKNASVDIVYNVVVAKNKNGKKSLKLRSGSIKFKNFFEQLAVPFKIYADFESLLKGV